MFDILHPTFRNYETPYFWYFLCNPEKAELFITQSVLIIFT
ncbi:hypothetical protein NIES806_21380 [Dolichospermum compactum NIES-806]|jgi:hypothetical protein|uniref:Uncharacterized protein n=1 Tax=Dolichospermum compactum NIES-806 TaxID=1973481 RepID=A0A1Z4V3C5_9CYAN|nr:hypothetical protein NIES806_21380 [Dolichospermum compactum NIES-806]